MGEIIVDGFNRRYTDVSMYTHLRAIAALTGMATLVLLGLIVFWLLYPYKPVEILEEGDFHIVAPTTKVVTQGGHISYEFEYKKNTDDAAIIERQFVDGIIFNVAEGSQNPSALVGRGGGTARSEVHIPETLPPGLYQLRIVATYRVNPIRDVRVVGMTEEFEVVEKDCPKEDE